MLSDTDLMPFGKHRGEKMENVPTDYLLWLYDSGKVNSQVKEYIEDNIDVLKQEVKQKNNKK